MNRRLCAVLLAALAVAAVGCGEKTPKANTPAQAVAKMAQAALDGDRQAYFASFEATEAELKALSGVFEFIQAGVRFRDKLIATYGQAAWDTFQADPGGGATINLPDARSPEDYDVEIAGDAAMCRAPGGQPPIALARVDGQWLIKSASLLPPGANGSDVGKMMAARAEVVDACAEKIGQDGVTPEILDEQLGEALLHVTLGQ